MIICRKQKGEKSGNKDQTEGEELFSTKRERERKW